MIVNTVNQMAFAADLRDWDLCRSCFADEVFVDYTSLHSGEAGMMTSKALIETWQRLLPIFDPYQHMIGSHVVEIQGDRAECRAHFQAVHVLEDEQWILGGRYYFRLQRNGDAWQITAITMTALWSVGDQARRLQLAAERASRQ
jgi:hypothetical protein